MHRSPGHGSDLGFPWNYKDVAVRSKRLPTITGLVKSLPWPPASPSSPWWSWRSSITSALGSYSDPRASREAHQRVTRRLPEAERRLAQGRQDVSRSRRAKGTWAARGSTWGGLPNGGGASAFP
jgi:hypothetical protein